MIPSKPKGKPYHCESLSAYTCWELPEASICDGCRKADEWERANPITRLARRNVDKALFKLKAQGGVFDMFDNVFKETYRVTDSEFDWLAEHLNNEELGLITTDPNITPFTFSQKRQLLLILRRGYGK